MSVLVFACGGGRLSSVRGRDGGCGAFLDLTDPSGETVPGVVKIAEFSSSRSLLDSTELAYVMRQVGEDFIMGTQHVEMLSRLQRESSNRLFQQPVATP